MILILTRIHKPFKPPFASRSSFSRQALTSLVNDPIANHSSRFIQQNSNNLTPSSQNQQWNNNILNPGPSQAYDGVPAPMPNPTSFSTNTSFAPHPQHQQWNNDFELDPGYNNALSNHFPSTDPNQPLNPYLGADKQSQPSILTNEDDFESQTRMALLQNGYGISTQQLAPNSTPNPSLMYNSPAPNSSYQPPQLSMQGRQHTLTFLPGEGPQNTP